MRNPRPTADTISEDQVLNFLANALTEEFTLDLGESAKIDPEEIFEVLVGGTADGTSISTLCEESEDAPSGNDVLYHLRIKFDLETVESTVNTLLQQMFSKHSPNRWRSSRTSRWWGSTVELVIKYRAPRRRTPR